MTQWSVIEHPVHAPPVARPDPTETDMTSSSTDTAHHIRFLLAGSNPIGMTGGSSLMLGAVDSILDWREDQGDRHRRPLMFYLLTIYKLLMTPIGGGVEIRARNALAPENLLEDERGEVATRRESIKLDHLSRNQWWWD